MTADLAVVGGGLIGCFVAHQAARLHPDWQVVLFERSAIGSGATAWSAGVSFPLAATLPHRHLVRASAAGYARLRDTTARQFLRPVRMVYVVGRDRRRALRDRIVDADLRAVTGDERQQVERMLPDVQFGAGEEMLTHDGHGIVVNARALAEWLVADCVAVQLGQRITEVQPDANGYRLVADRAEWSARRVVVASGPWPVPARGPASLPAGPPVRVKRIAALYARVPAEPDDPLVYFLDDDLFFLPMFAGSVLVSFYRDAWDIDPASVDGQASEEDLRCGIDVVQRRSASAAAAVTGGRAFCDGYTHQRLPVVTSDPANRGLASIRGGSGSGVRLAPALAAEALRAADSPTPNSRPTNAVRPAAQASAEPSKGGIR